MKTIDLYSFRGKKALIRVDFNVPLDTNLQITDTTRIDAAMPTIKKVLHDGGAVILISHLGRPKAIDKKLSLASLIPYLSKSLNIKVKFADDCMGQSAVEMSRNLQMGEALLLENLRFYAEEEGKPRVDKDADEATINNAKAEIKLKQKEFTKQLASYADCYINDAFGTAHRAHASTALIANYFENNKMFGYLMNAEVFNLNKILLNSKKPFTAVLGGAKISTKIQLINNLLNKVDNIIIGGGMTFTFIKALNGNIGNSLIEDDFVELAKSTLNKAKLNGVNIILPIDIKIANVYANDAETKIVDANNIPNGWMGLDIGDKTIEMFNDILLKSETILWNGPMGVFEMSNFAKGTIEIAKSIAKSTENGAFSLVGGGDSVAAVKQFNLDNNISYVSTGGGAMLEFIEGKKLPGVAAIEE